MDAEGGGTGAGQAAQPVRDGLTRLQGTERNTAALPRKGRGGGQKPFRGIFRLYGGFPPEHGGVQRRHRLQKSLPAPRFLVSPGTGSPEPTRYRRQAVCARTTVKLHILNISLNYGMMNYYIF